MCIFSVTEYIPDCDLRRMDIIVIIIIIINIMTDNVISIIIFYEGNDTQAPSLTEIQQNYTNVVRALARH